MTVNKRRKFSRMRGTHTHGWGAKKKHRGKGHRGGKGMAGTGKRGDAKKPSIWKEDYFGKKGFKMQGVTKQINPINIVDIEMHLDKFVEKKLIEIKDGQYVVDLSKLGYNKLLGTGTINHKYNITVESASSQAIEKVKEAGGQVIVSAKISNE